MKITDMISIMSDKDAKTIHEFEHRLSDSVEHITESIKTDSVVKDAYGNTLLAIGNDDKVSKFNNYTFSNDTLNWPLWLALYNESWVFRRAIDKPAQDEIRCGITLKNNNKEAETQRALALYRDDLIQLLSWGALFGGSVAVALFDNFKKEDYMHRFNRSKVAQAKVLKFYITDRWYGLSPDYNNTVKNMSDQDYGKPKYYSVTMSDGKTYTYHHDYVIRYEHRFAPRLIKNGMLQGWGYSEGSHILNELTRDEKLKSSIQSLVDKSLIEVIKMSGMRGVFMGTDEANQKQLEKRLEMVNWGRTYNSLTFLDKDDDYTMNNFQGLGGLADLLQQNMWLIASALEMQGVLFGDLKGGLTSDSESLERYAETILNRCETYVRPVYTKLLKYIYTMLGINTKIDFTFNSIIANKEKDKKLSDTSAFVSLCSALLTDGIISTTQYAKALKKYLSNNVIDFELTDDNIKKLAEESDMSSENFDINSDDLNI